MSTDTVWLEVQKGNGAILSYYTEQPTDSSASVEHVQATQAELAYLNALEDFIFPAGMVATLSDLEAHRARVLAGQKAKPTTAIKSPANTSQKPTSRSKQTPGKISRADFLAGLKRVDKPSKQGEKQ